MIKEYIDGEYLITEYANGTIIKSMLNEPLTLEQVKQQKINEIELNCDSILNGGFKSNCLGVEKNFSSTEKNRNLIMGLVSKAMLLINGVDLPDRNLDWKSTDEPICYAWTPQQILLLGSDMSTFLTANIKKKELLQEYVRNLVSVDSVNEVNWDTVIPSMQ
jgi:hypothetical protein